jgi:hypothetical protein
VLKNINYSGCFDSLLDIYSSMLSIATEHVREVDDIDYDWSPDDLKRKLYGKMEEVHDYTRIKIAKALVKTNKNEGS